MKAKVKKYIKKREINIINEMWRLISLAVEANQIITMELTYEELILFRIGGFIILISGKRNRNRGQSGKITNQKMVIFLFRPEGRRMERGAMEEDED